MANLPTFPATPTFRAGKRENTTKSVKELRNNELHLLADKHKSVFPSWGRPLRLHFLRKSSGRYCPGAVECVPRTCVSRSVSVCMA